MCERVWPVAARFSREGILPPGRGTAVVVAAAAVLATASAYAGEPVVIDSTFERRPLGLHMDYLEDPSRDLTIEQVASPALAARFTPCPREQNGFGYSPSAYWFRFRTDNQHASRAEWLLDVGYGLLDRVTLFEERPHGGFRAREAGIALPFLSREVRHRTAVFPVTQPRGVATHYVRVETNSPVVVPFTAFSPGAFERHRTNEAALLWLFYGLMAGMLLYNLFLFVSVGSRTYLFYILYIFAFSMFQLAQNGLAAQYLWPWAGGWNGQATLALGYLAGLGIILFSRSFLETRRRTPRLDVALVAFSWASVAGVGLAVHGGVSTLSHISAFVALVVAATLICAGIVVLRRGFRPARLYIAAWFTLLVGVVLTLLRALGVLPVSFVTAWGYQIAAAGEAVLLSLALAARINYIRDSLAALNAELEDKVRQRTKSLKAATVHLKSRSADLEAMNHQLQAANRRLLDEAKERRRAERERTRLEEQLLQSQKIEAVGRLAGGIAHDMNNMLGAIMAFASGLHEGMDPSDPKRTDVAEILSAGRRGRDLTANLLGFARKGTHLKLAVTLNELVEEVQRLLERTVSKKFVVDTKLQADIDAIEGDPGQLSHALMNLCLNGIDAMGREGVLTLVTRNISIGAEDGDNFGGLEHGPYVQLLVSDSGQGMDQETLSQVFEPFFTTKGPGEGTGLGLSMVYGVVMRHAGLITIQSEEGKGTTATLTFPAAGAARVSKLSSSPPEQRARRGNGRILLVDDEAMIRRAGCRLLQGLGYDVVVAPDGKSAVSQYSDGPGSFDVVILDLIMPVMDGKETFAALMQVNPDIKVVISSGYSREGEPEELLEKGAKGFLPKPFDLHTLADTVARVLGAVEDVPDALPPVSAERRALTG